jgi:uncharacterized membrane protein
MKERNEKSSMLDIYAAILLVLLAIASIMIAPVSKTPVRTVMGLALTLFLPGYCLVAALFPRKTGLGLLERIALSFGLSIAVTPLLGLVLNYTPYGIKESSVLAAVSLFTLAFALIAYARRMGVEPGERFSIAIGNKPVMPENRLDKALTLLLILSIVASLAVLVYVIVTPKQGEKFTEFYILGPDGKAENYPTKLAKGATGTVIIGVVNHEYENIDYTLKIFLGNDSLEEKKIPLSDNQTYSAQFSFSPARNGTEKLAFDLYRNESADSPYRSLHLWVSAA